MAENNRTDARNISDLNASDREVRTPRTVRFSDSEWQRVKTAAADRGISFGSFVREAAMIHASTQNLTETVAISAGLEALIRQTFRYVALLSAVKRNQLMRDGQENELKTAIEFAQQAETELLPQL